MMKILQLLSVLIVTSLSAQVIPLKNKPNFATWQKMPVCLTEMPTLSPLSFTAARTTARRLMGVQPQQKVVVDLLFAYDKRAVSFMENSGYSRDAFARAAMTALNTAMKNSQLNIEFHLVHQINVDNEILDGRDNISDSLNAMVNITGKFTTVNEARDQYGADLVVYFIDGDFDGAAGKAATLWNKRGYDRNAFAVVTMRYALGAHTLVHEVGHLFGAYHDAILGDGPHPRLGQYAAGWAYDGAENDKYVTVMSYFDFDQLRLPVFSSPDVGYPKNFITGDAQKGDNRRIIIETAKLVSQYRNRNAVPFSPQTVALNQAAGNQLTFTTGGDSDWFGQNLVARNGTALQSGHLAIEQNTWLETTVTGPGTLSFDWKRVTNAPLKLYIDGVEQSIRFYVDNPPMKNFAKKEIAIDEGKHTIRWTVERRAMSYPSYLNAVWLDNIRFSDYLLEDSFEVP